MAYPVTLNGRTYTLADFEGNNYVDGLPDAFEDFVTHAGDIYNDTSTTSNSIGTGSKTFTVAAGKPYQAGTPLRIADAAAPATNFLDAVVTSYSGTTLVVEAIGYGGSGTLTSWTVNIGGAKTIDGTLGVSQGGTGATTAAAARTNLDTYSKTEADSRFLNVSGEASDVTMNGNVTIGDAGTDTLTINAATTTTADISFGDNDKAIFGAGSDLQIYHDGNSKITDVGDGKLELHSNGTGVFIQKGATEYMAQFLTDGAVTLYHDNAVKLATTSTGIDVTGTVTADAYALDSIALPSAGTATIFNRNTDNSLYIQTDSGNTVYLLDGSQNTMYAATPTSHVFQISNAEKMRIESNGALLLGATSRSVYYNSVNVYNASAVIKTNVSNEVADLVITNGNNDFGSSVDFARTNSAGNDVRFATISAQPTNTTAGTEAGVIRFYTKGTGDSNVVERMRILADGGITFNGDTAAANALDDYEEGTWTPQFDANTVTWSYTHQAGNYVKIGNMVHAQFYILASVASGTSSFGTSLINLPFTSGNVSSFNNYAVPLWFSGSPDIRPLVNNNSTRCTLQIYNSVSGATAADLDGHYFVGTASYRSA